MCKLIRKIRGFYPDTIRYINAGNEYGESHANEIEVFDQSIKFAWRIDNHATRYSGLLFFTIQFETIKDNVEYQWQTTPAELNILSGLKIEDTLTDKNDTLFRSLSNQVQSLQTMVNTFKSEIKKIPLLESEISQLQKEISYLKENVVYTLSE